MTLKIYKTLSDINNSLLEHTNMNVILDFSELSSIWSLAIRHNKTQNSYISDGYSEDVVCQKDLFDEGINECRIVSFRASLRWSKIQWATLLIADSMYLTKQKIKAII